MSYKCSNNISVFFFNRKLESYAFKMWVKEIFGSTEIFINIGKSVCHSLPCFSEESLLQLHNKLENILYKEVNDKLW